MQKKHLLGSIIAAALMLTSVEATVYEEGTGVENWKLLDGTSTARAYSIADTDRGGDVIQFVGDGLKSGYIYGYAATEWNNNTEKTLKWSMQYSEDYSMYVRLRTTKGFRFLQYTPEGTGGHKEVYIHHVLGASTKDGTWQDFERDLEADLKMYEPDNSITEIDGIIFRGSGKVDDIELLGASVTPPPVVENQAPVADAGEDKTINEGDTVTITGTGTDSDGTVVSYEWKEGSAVLATTASFDYTSSTVGTHTLTLTVTDNEGATHSDSMDVVVSSISTPVTQEVALCQNQSAYLDTLYQLGMTIDSPLNHGSVLAKNNNFVGAVFCGAFANATSSTEVLESIKSNAFAGATNIILNNNADGSIKAQYELNGVNTQAYAQLKLILEAVGETDFSAYPDFSSFDLLQNLYIDIYVKYLDSSTTYVIVTVTDKTDNNADALNKLVSAGTIANSASQNNKVDTFTYTANTLKSDILFVMDDSGSMSSEQSAASQAIITTFGDAMNTNGVDWKATVIGTEEGRDYLNKHISDPSENNITKLSNQLLLGTNGGDEVGLKRAYEYLNNGDVTIRNGSTLAMVYVSDEYCHTSLSELGVFDINDSYFVQNGIKVNIIIPENLSNNNNLAYQMANMTGGEIANIYNYTTGYNAMMQKIADDAAGSASTLVLSETPIIASIQVTVNGVVMNAGWTYNPANNSIVFEAASAPSAGDAISVTYNY